MARSLLAGQGFGVEAVGFVRPPLYPIFVAMCYAIGGLAMVQAAQVVVGATTAVLIGHLARALSVDARDAAAAALIAAVYPWSIQFVPSLATETLFTFLAVATFLGVLSVARVATEARAALCGILFGLSGLVRANFLLLAPGLALVMLISRRSITSVIVFGAGTLLALAPFTAYAMAQGWGPLIASGSGGINFYTGNNPAVARLFDPGISDDEWRRVNSSGPSDPISLRYLGCESATTVQHCADHLPIAQRDRFYYDAGFRWIGEDPARWARITAAKLVRQWTPWVEPRAYPISIVVVSGLSFGAVLLLTIVAWPRLRPDARWLIAVVAVGVTITGVLTLVQLRYRFPLLDPLLIAAAGPPIERVASRAFAGFRPTAR